MHVCAGCGGEHPVSQFSSNHAGKGLEVETEGRVKADGKREKTTMEKAGTNFSSSCTRQQ